MVSIKNLPFETIPASEAKNVLKGKSGFLSFGGDKKKLAKCIEEGKAGLCEVVVAGQSLVDADGLKFSYGVVLTKDTRELCEECVILPTDLGTFYDPQSSTYGRSNARGELENDEGKRKALDGKQGYVMHYFIGDLEVFYLLTPELAGDLAKLAPEACPSNDCLLPLGNPNSSLISVTELPFEPIPASEAEKLLKGGDPAYTYVHAETLAKQIENGKAGWCEVATAGVWMQKEKKSIWDTSDRETEYYEMAVLLTKDRSRLCAEGVFVPDGMEIKYDGSLTECANARAELECDAAKRQALDCGEGYVIHYTLADEDVYCLISPEAKADLSRFTELVKPPENAKCLIPLP